MNLLKSAKWYAQQSCSIIATGDTKRAIMSWKEYQTRIATNEELTNQFQHPKALGIAVICGAVSGGLEVIDVDLKNDTTNNLWQKLLNAAPIINDLYTVKTKSGGYHIYYRCEVIEGNIKLANRPANADELKDSPHIKEVVLIETRGEGGYVIAPPTDGYVKQSDFNLTQISIEQREELLSACRSFNEIIVNVKPTITQANESFAITPWDDYNERSNPVELLERHGWSVVSQYGERTIFKRPGTTESKSSGDYHHALKLFKVFTTSSQFEVGKGYSPYAIYTLLEHNNDFSKSAKQLLADGFGTNRIGISTNIQRDVLKKKEQGLGSKDIAAFISQKHTMKVQDAEELINQLEEQWGEKICTFWSVSDKGAITINRSKLIDFLCDVGGFYLYYYDTKSSIHKIIRIVDGFVEEVNSEKIKKYLNNYIESLPSTFDGITPNDLREVIYKGADAYFSKSLFEFMKCKELNLLKDTKDAAFFPFKNGVLKITNDTKELLKYGDVGLHVWKDQIIDFNIDIEKDIDVDNVQFYQFIKKICNDEADRISYVISLIGYLLHKFKDPTKPFAVILAEETEKDKEGGGTGKGIFYKAISKLLSVVFVDGKNFKLDKSFAFQRVELSTQLVVIEDCRKNVDFEGFYSNITEGVTVEKKNKDELYISYADAPKFGFTTNYTINLNGNHGKRRAKVIEFSNFFSPNRSPFDFFGNALFTDWDLDEWNRFYNFMIETVQVFLSDGIPTMYNSNSINRKNIKLNFGEDFLDYFDSINHNQWHQFSGEYTNFLNTNELEKKDYSQLRFKKGLETASELFEYEFETQRNRQNNNKHEFKITSSAI